MQNGSNNESVDSSANAGQFNKPSWREVLRNKSAPGMDSLVGNIDDDNDDDDDDDDNNNNGSCPSSQGSPQVKQFCKDVKKIHYLAWKTYYIALCPHCKAAGRPSGKIFFCKLRKEKYTGIQLNSDGFVNADSASPQWASYITRTMRDHYHKEHHEKDLPTCVGPVYRKMSRDVRGPAGQKVYTANGLLRCAKALVVTEIEELEKLDDETATKRLQAALSLPMMSVTFTSCSDAVSALTAMEEQLKRLSPNKLKIDAFLKLARNTGDGDDNDKGATRLYKLVTAALKTTRRQRKFLASQGNTKLADVFEKIPRNTYYDAWGKMCKQYVDKFWGKYNARLARAPSTRILYPARKRKAKKGLPFLAHEFEMLQFAFCAVAPVEWGADFLRFTEKEQLLTPRDRC
jgi:hypothetical protein